MAHQPFWPSKVLALFFSLLGQEALLASTNHGAEMPVSWCSMFQLVSVTLTLVESTIRSTMTTLTRRMLYPSWSSFTKNGMS